MGDLDFSHAEVERASRYHRPLYLVFAARLLLALTVYSLLAWSWVGDRLSAALDGAGWAGAATAWAAVVIVVAALARLPLDVWRGLVYERRWGFSKQTAAGWAADEAKGLGLALPRWWWLPAVAALALLTVFFSFVAPVVLEPLFNRFEPLADEHLAAELRRLSVEAGVPVASVLVSDASKRTTKSNAY